MNFECHITTTVADAAKAEQIANDFHWKTSEIKRDPILGDGSHFYLTAHETDYNRMFSKMRQASAALKEAGCTVLREKIEGILFDTKTRTAEGVMPDHLDDKAVNAFARNMKARLADKRSQGFGGWNDPGVCQVRRDLMSRLSGKALYIDIASLQGLHDVHRLMTRCLDIANFAMMTYHRVQHGVARHDKLTFCQKCDQTEADCSCPPSYKKD